jgi:hypothetical protein
MRRTIRTGVVSIVVAMSAAGCQQQAQPGASGASTAASPSTAAPPAPPPAAAAAWPGSLPAFGDGFPNAGDPCRRIGESAATANFLDHTAALVGCLSADDAAKLGGRVVATIDGVTLVSVPHAPSAAPGGGEAQDDAKAPGTT